MSPEINKTRAYRIDFDTLHKPFGQVIAELKASGKLPADATDISFVPGGVAYNRKSFAATPIAKPAEPKPVELTADEQKALAARQVALEQQRLKAERAPYLEKLQRDAVSVRERKGFEGRIQIAGVMNAFRDRDKSHSLAGFRNGVSGVDQSDRKHGIRMPGK